jgi:hypothetical protein
MTRCTVCRIVPLISIALVVGPTAMASRAADLVSETRAVSGLDRVRLEGAFTAQITAGAPRTVVVVAGSRAAVSRVTTEVRAGALVVGMRPGLDLAGPGPRLEIRLPVLRGFANDGAGSVRLDGLTGGDVAIESGGAASIVAAGRAARERIALNGAGKIDVTGVDARDVTVANDGVGSVRVRAARSLTMNLNGIGEIRYAGNPALVKSHVNGIGSVGRL